MTSGAAAEAEARFQQATTVARRQSAKSLELRATVSLARLWQSQRKREKARQMLAEIYGWFTEGFDTVDLREAKELLDALVVIVRLRHDGRAALDTIIEHIPEGELRASFVGLPEVKVIV